MPFPQSWDRVPIAPKELLPIVLAFRMWAPIIRNTNILFLCDNIAVVEVICRKTAKDALMAGMVRQMMVTALICNIEFSAKHIPGKVNCVCDHLSRLQTQKAFDLAPWLQKDPVPVSPQWLPW